MPKHKSLTKLQTPVCYFAMIPHSIDDLGLSPHTYRLYGHLVRVAGEEGDVWQTTEQIAKVCGVSKTTIVKSKKELEYLGLIDIRNNGHSHRHYITIVDIWQQNRDYYSPAIIESGVPHSGTRGVPLSGTRGGTVSLLSKKNPVKENPLKNNYIPTASEQALIDLPGWDNSIESTADWYGRFILDFPAFNTQDIKACRDFHGEDIDGNRMTGRWKVRLRQWMLHKKPRRETNGQRGTEARGYPQRDRATSGKALAQSVGQPLR